MKHFQPSNGIIFFRFLFQLIYNVPPVLKTPKKRQTFMFKATKKDEIKTKSNLHKFGRNTPNILKLKLFFFYTMISFKPLLFFRWEEYFSQGKHKVRYHIKAFILHKTQFFYIDRTFFFSHVDSFLGTHLTLSYWKVYTKKLFTVFICSQLEI